MFSISTCRTLSLNCFSLMNAKWREDRASIYLLKNDLLIDFNYNFSESYKAFKNDLKLISSARSAIKYVSTFLFCLTVYFSSPT